MALIQLNYASEVLAMQTNVTILLPEKSAQFKNTKQQPYKVLYLLHGLSDDNVGWYRYTTIESIVRDTNLAVVMPCCDHSFYTDMVHGHPFFTYVTKELPRYIQNILPISNRREDTFICGNSMGGYGAFKCALTLPEHYAKAASLSGALDIQDFVHTYQMPGFDPKWTFGETLDLQGGSNDLYYLLDQAVKKKKQLPAMYSFCGSEDSLVQYSRDFYAFAQELSLDYVYKEKPGEHLWVVWQNEVLDMVTWLLQE